MHDKISNFYNKLKLKLIVNLTGSKNKLMQLHLAHLLSISTLLSNHWQDALSTQRK